MLALPRWLWHWWFDRWEDDVNQFPIFWRVWMHLWIVFFALVVPTLIVLAILDAGFGIDIFGGPCENCDDV